MSISIWLQFEGMTSESFNITHNVNSMWHKAGCYDALYNSEGKLSKEVSPILQLSLLVMLARPEEFKELNPENGWGDYDGAIDFLVKVIKEFNESPSAKIVVSK